ncbi:energy-coupling factor transport system substrate-specific component [Haloactinospora alba]|uniref:Energy-coupling factor transport system substrate-specific component n=1 Tax=Haloactinospora alba TaxID=405555 RepID=A0A543NGC1_9ACTN|nr:ECF transporter S component [Haloactinospora alba]TQN30844.1 energy-coupling factor transport system substrate-specific component [Haloactinospora alba]
MTSTPPEQPTFDTPPRATWRTVDLVVAAVVGAAVGVVFWFWGMLWAATQPLFVFFPPAQAVLYGIWLLPGVLGGLIIRKPGAAVLTSTAAAFVSMVLGTQWGVMVILSGVLQGLFPEAVFAALRYRRWGTVAAVAAAVAAALAPAVMDNLRYYPTWPLTFQLAFAGIVLLSSAVIAGLGGRLLTTALARSGALTAFPSGRE